MAVLGLLRERTVFPPLTMDHQKKRQTMVNDQIMARGVKDQAVLEAMRKVPREAFVPEAQAFNAYDDRALSIGEGQTISQPYMVALMTECLDLKPDDCVLEIGTGSGYQTAILAEICHEVYTIERITALSQRAQELLKEMGYQNIHFLVADGTLGIEEKQNSFDGIIITSAAPKTPVHMFDQLKEGGRLVIPIGSRDSQMLKLFIKHDGKISEEDICSCVFVPLIGQYGW